MSVVGWNVESVAPETFQKWGHKFRRKAPGNFFTVPPLFRGAPMTGHYRKVPGTVTRTELGQKWPTVRGQNDLWLFKVTLCQRWPRQKIELGWLPSHLLTPTPYHASIDIDVWPIMIYEVFCYFLFDVFLLAMPLGPDIRESGGHVPPCPMMLAPMHWIRLLFHTIHCVSRCDWQRL